MLPVYLIGLMESRPLILDMAASLGGKPPTWLPAVSTRVSSWQMIRLPESEVKTVLKNEVESFHYQFPRNFCLWY